MAVTILGDGSAVPLNGAALKKKVTVPSVTVPDAPNLYSADYLTSGGYSRLIYFVPSDGGSPITGYKTYFDGVLTTPGYSFPGNASGLDYFTDIFFANYTGQTAEVSAVNAIGEGAKAAKTVVAV